MLDRENSYGKFQGKIELNENLLEDNVYYLTEIDEKYRRSYNIKNPSPLDMNKTPISGLKRLESLNKSMQG
jgi:hypothetical protein